MRTYAVIERPEGTTYVQEFCGLEGLQDLIEMLGPDYWIVDIF